MRPILLSILFLWQPLMNSLAAQQTVNFISPQGQIIYADLDSWWSRQFDNAGILGGGTILYHEPGPDRYQQISETIPLLTPWSTSNAQAKIGRIVTGSTSVFREKRGGGYCARLETRLDKVQVLGIINMKAVASGTLFLGEMMDPVTDLDEPRRNAVVGIPFEGRPRALQFDYKLDLQVKRVQAEGDFRVSKVEGRDQAQIYVLLQHRSVTPEGQLQVKRVATAWIRLDQPQADWRNTFELPFHYGDFRQTPHFKRYMGLLSANDQYYTMFNGQVVPFVESGWANSEEKVTHLILIAESSYEGSMFRGAEGNTLWLDNIRLVY